MPTPTMASATGQVAMRPRPMMVVTPRNVPRIRCTQRPKAPSNSGWMIATMVMSSQARAGQDREGPPGGDAGEDPSDHGIIMCPAVGSVDGRVDGGRRRRIGRMTIPMIHTWPPQRGLRRQADDRSIEWRARFMAESPGELWPSL